MMGFFPLTIFTNFRLLSLFTLFSLFCACSQTARDNSWFDQDQRLAVLSTTEMIESLVREVGKEEIKSLSLISHGLDPHTYELVKGDDEKLLRADLIFFNGLGLEHGSSLKYALQTNPNAFSLSQELGKDAIIYHGSTPDPHIWMDLSLFSKTIDTIVFELTRARPDKQEFFEQNGNALRKRLLALHNDAKALFTEIPPEKRYLVTTHDAFHYFARAYLATKEELKGEAWRIRCKAPEGLAPDGQISITILEDLLRHIRTYRVTSLFAEEAINQDSLRKLVEAARETGMEISIPAQTLYSDSLGGPGSPVENYFQMIPYNSKIIAEHIGRNGGV